MPFEAVGERLQMKPRTERLAEVDKATQRLQEASVQAETAREAHREAAEVLNLADLAAHRARSELNAAVHALTFGSAATVPAPDEPALKTHSKCRVCRRFGCECQSGTPAPAEGARGEPASGVAYRDYFEATAARDGEIARLRDACSAARDALLAVEERLGRNGPSYPSEARLMCDEALSTAAAPKEKEPSR